MRLMIAGATGAIGRPLIRCLTERGHAVFALARSPESARAVAASGAEPVIADALDAAAVKTALVQVQPEAVINELTSLPRHYTPAEMKAASERDRKVRIEGNTNLLAALRDAGVRRYLLQSSGFWYAPGEGLADEGEPFAYAASPAVAAGSRRYAELERTAATAGIDFVALRYGFFYGPSTWFNADGDIGDQVRRRQLPVIGEGQGVWNWVHIEDARQPPPPRSTAHRAPITSSTATRSHSTAGCRPSRARSAHRRRTASPRRRRWPRSALTP